MLMHNFCFLERLPKGRPILANKQQITGDCHAIQSSSGNDENEISRPLQRLMWKEKFDVDPSSDEIEL